MTVPERHPLPTFLSTIDSFHLPDIRKTYLNFKRMANLRTLNLKAKQKRVDLPHDSSGDETCPVIKLNGMIPSTQILSDRMLLKCDDTAPGKKLSISYDNGVFSTDVSIETLRHGSRRVARLKKFEDRPYTSIAKPNCTSFSGSITSDVVLPSGTTMIHRPEVVWRFDIPSIDQFSEIRIICSDYFTQIAELSRPDTRGKCGDQRARLLKGWRMTMEDARGRDRVVKGLLNLLMDDNVKTKKDFTPILEKIETDPFFGLNPSNLGEHEAALCQFYRDIARISWGKYLGGKKSRLGWFDNILNCALPKTGPLEELKNHLRNWKLTWWTKARQAPNDEEWEKAALFHMIGNRDDFAIFRRALDIDLRDRDACLAFSVDWFNAIRDKLGISFVDMIGGGNDSAIKVGAKSIDFALFLCASEKYVIPIIESSRDRLEDLGNVLLRSACKEIIEVEVVCDRIKHNDCNKPDDELPEVEFSLTNSRMNSSMVSEVGYTAAIHDKFPDIPSDQEYYRLKLVMRLPSSFNDNNPVFNPYECFITLPGFMRMCDDEQILDSISDACPIGFLDEDGRQLIHVCFTEFTNGEYRVQIPMRITKENLDNRSSSKFTFCFRTMFNENHWRDEEAIMTYPPDDIIKDRDNDNYQHYPQPPHNICSVAWWCERTVIAK
jgi:hypothetical protein